MSVHRRMSSKVKQCSVQLFVSLRQGFCRLTFHCPLWLLVNIEAEMTWLDLTRLVQLAGTFGKLLVLHVTHGPRSQSFQGPALLRPLKITLLVDTECVINAITSCSLKEKTVNCQEMKYVICSLLIETHANLFRLRTNLKEIRILVQSESNFFLFV